MSDFLIKKNIQMTSNSTPEPFLIEGSSTDLYKMFDNDENTTFMMNYRQQLIFNITLNRREKINKIIIIFSSIGGCFFTSFSLYGISDDNTETLITTQGQSSYTSPFSITFDSDNYYKKYKISINSSVAGNFIYIQEIQLFTNDYHTINFNDQFYYFDDENNIMSYEDINLYSKYLLGKINSNIDKLKNHYPFKMMKFIPK